MGEKHFSCDVNIKLLLINPHRHNLEPIPRIYLANFFYNQF